MSRGCNSYAYLILPGWQNSGAAHWQSRWQELYGYQRVEQHDWMRPLRGDWIMQLEEVILALPRNQPVVLVAHSLGCQLVAAWAQSSRLTERVTAAFLVAPGDPQCVALRVVLPSWCPPVLQTLPFKSMVLASQDDLYCSFERATLFAKSWGASLKDCGNVGHINADTGLGDWSEGQVLLENLIKNQI